MDWTQDMPAKEKAFNQMEYIALCAHIAWNHAGLVDRGKKSLRLWAQNANLIQVIRMKIVAIQWATISVKEDKADLYMSAVAENVLLELISHKNMNLWVATIQEFPAGSWLVQSCDSAHHLTPCDVDAGERHGVGLSIEEGGS